MEEWSQPDVLLLECRISGRFDLPRDKMLASDYSGVIILTVSGGYHSQKMGLFPFNPPLRG